MKLRLVIGAAIVAFAWGLYVIRVSFGVGPMHDHQGGQAPEAHYLFGAVSVTVMVVIWNFVRALMDRKGRKPPV